ncbi:MAG: PEP-CTERM sorting domain-containing protein [Tepidisphaeraceae bacterium]
MDEGRHLWWEDQVDGTDDDGTDEIETECSSFGGYDVAALDAFAAANGLLVDVPEPASAVMMVMAGLGILRRRRRRN